MRTSTTGTDPEKGSKNVSRKAPEKTQSKRTSPSWIDMETRCTKSNKMKKRYKKQINHAGTHEDMQINNKKQWAAAGSTVKTVYFLWTCHDFRKDAFFSARNINTLRPTSGRVFFRFFSVFRFSFRLHTHISPLFICGNRRAK